MKRPFTLIEILVVLVILAVVLGTVVPRLLRIPARIQIEGAHTGIASALRECAMRAVASGRTVRVRLAAEAGVFQVTTAPPERDVLSDSKLPDAHAEEARTHLGPVPTTASYKIPRSVTWELDRWGAADDPEDMPLFVFHPDGGASGPDLVFTVAKRQFSLRVDRLTGHTEIRAVEQ